MFQAGIRFAEPFATPENTSTEGSREGSTRPLNPVLIHKQYPAFCVEQGRAW